MDQVRERQDRRLEQQILLEEQEDREQAVDDHDRHQVNRGPLQLNLDRDADQDDQLLDRHPPDNRDQLPDEHNQHRMEPIRPANPLDIMTRMMEHMGRDQQQQQQQQLLLQQLIQQLPTRDDAYNKVARYPPLTKDGDLGQFLEGFESHMKSYAVPKALWPRQLLPSLNQTAVGMYSSMDEQDQKEYEQVKRTLLREFNIGPDTYRRKIKQDSKDPNESWTTYCHRVQRNHTQWLHQCRTKEDFIQIYAMDFMFTELPPYLAAKVKEGKPTSIREMAQLADTHINLMADTKIRRVPYQDQSSYQKKTYAPQPNEDRYKQQIPARQNQQPGTPPTTTPVEKESFRRRDNRPENDWNEEYHRKKEDPESLPNSNAQGQPKCFKCHTYGHIARNCTIPTRTVNTVHPKARVGDSIFVTKAVIEGSTSSDVLVDTGSGQTMV